MAYTLAFATLAIGHLNILTITFVPILIGLAIDFGVHLITRYEEELRHGKTEEEAMIKAIVFTGQGICTGAFTTAGAFLAMGFTNFKGIQEMGVICGGGLLICLVPMMTLLPVWLMRAGRQNTMDHEGNFVELRRARIEQVLAGPPGHRRRRHRRPLPPCRAPVAQDLLRLRPAQHAEPGPAGGGLRKETDQFLQRSPARHRNQHSPKIHPLRRGGRRLGRAGSSARFTKSASCPAWPTWIRWPRT